MILEVNRRKKQIRLSMKATLPEPAENLNKPKRGRGGKKRSGRSVAAMMAEINDEPKTPEHTAMEMAWQAALDRADSSRKSKAKANKKSESNEAQEELLSRTLEQRK